MKVERRPFLGGLLGLLGLLAVSPADAGPRQRRRRRRRRRRIRRRVLWRTVGGRRLLVVPLAVAVGWELMVDDRVVIVHEVRPDVIVVKDASGKTEEIAVVKEDDAENAKELEGSETDEEEDEPESGSGSKSP